MILLTLFRIKNSFSIRHSFSKRARANPRKTKIKSVFVLDKRNAKTYQSRKMGIGEIEIIK